jgi:hypothetical protein
MLNILTKCLFALIFIAVITPLGVLLRISGVDFLERKSDKGASTFWKKHG